MKEQPARSSVVRAFSS